MIIEAHTLDGGAVVQLEFSTGVSAKFHSIWLRDNSFDNSTRSVGNGQRLITICDIDPRAVVTKLEILDDGEIAAMTFAPDGITSHFSSRWLLEHRYDLMTGESNRQSGWVSDRHETWMNSTLQDRIPRVSWPELRSSPRALLEWLAAVDRFGVAMIDGMPSESGSLCQVVETCGFVRETNYGKWFDVVAEVTPQNLANTNFGLQAHTDNPYRDPVPTLQLLACLENSVDGGESAIIDGFAIAKFLQLNDRPAFAILARYPVRFAYEGSTEVSLTSKRPIFELGPDGELLAVRFNNRSAAPFVDIAFDEMEEFYRAYRKFAECLDDPKFSVRFKLAPGQAFIVDNTRVLHARTEFHGSGKRWLQGCYADKDGLLSTLRVLQRSTSNAEIG